ncbi:MAG: tRNA (N6-isopentenyl adenosine(37)-C2)-methylthiotransferase MiaB [Alphaproteobacteria bacterium]|nr:tRNA (N6-isopentenyl adenosine(37)-C2)-methylthiotransferase MiaB [Alphaproteobacteria bacterium]
MPGTKKVFVKTFGCQMNVYDSERMSESLSPYGFTQTDSPEDADVVILNTCHIREKAAEKVYSELGRLRQIKDQRRENGKGTVVTVAGCVAQAEGAEIIARSPVVDLVVGPQSYHRLPDLVFRAQSESRRIVDTNFPEEDKFAKLPERVVSNAPAPGGARLASAFLTVQEGCDKFCTFCVVPYTRGMEFSRPVASLLDEARRLIERGVREITLLGQNVNAYHGEGPDGSDWTLAKLIAAMGDLEGLERVRYTTSHPHDMGDDLIAAHRDVPKLMPYLHLPFQAGADRILAAMNRKHTADQYRALIDKIRNARPDIALSTDIIVGFPGETETEFAQTLALVEEIGFAQAFSFKYSARPGTPAAKMDDQVAEDVKSERLQRLQGLLAVHTSRFNADCVGRTVPVLFERMGRQEGQLVGRSPYLQPVHAAGEQDLLGRIIPVEISGSGANSLMGVIRAA